MILLYLLTNLAHTAHVLVHYWVHIHMIHISFDRTKRSSLVELWRTAQPKFSHIQACYVGAVFCTEELASCSRFKKAHLVLMKSEPMNQNRF